MGVANCRLKMNLHFFGVFFLLVIAVNGAPKPTPKANPKPNPKSKADPKAQMAIIMSERRRVDYQDKYPRRQFGLGGMGGYGGGMGGYGGYGHGMGGYGGGMGGYGNYGGYGFYG